MAEGVEKVRSEPGLLGCVENLYFNYYRCSNCYLSQYLSPRLDGHHDRSKNTSSTPSARSGPSAMQSNRSAFPLKTDIRAASEEEQTLGDCLPLISRRSGGRAGRAEVDPLQKSGSPTRVTQKRQEGRASKGVICDLDSCTPWQMWSPLLWRISLSENCPIRCHYEVIT